MISTLNDEFEFLAPADKTQAAFDEAGQTPKIGDVVLHQWTCARHGVAIQMGSAVIQAIGPHVDPFLTGGNYPNRFRDVVIVLWLSSLDREEIKQLCALPDPEFRVIDAYEWAESVGATFGSKLFFDGARILGCVVRDILASVFSIDSSETDSSVDDKKKDTDQAGRSNTHLQQSGPVDMTPITSSTICRSPTSSNGGPCGSPGVEKARSSWFFQIMSAIKRPWKSWERS